MRTELESRRVRVSAIREAAIDILAFDLAPLDGRPLPAFPPGAHVDVHTPSGLVRQYSLCGDPAAAAGTWRIAVKKESQGRGGSLSMHEAVRAGTMLGVTGPRNHFPLAADASEHLLIAGGVGITPMHAMAQALAARGAAWKLHYCARSREHAAFLDELTLLGGSRVVPHFGLSPTLDVTGLLRARAVGTHVYCCGPQGLMKAVEAAASHWNPAHVHFEWFVAAETDGSRNVPFEVELARRRMTLAVPEDKSILRVLCEHGVHVESACEQGICGTCETAVLQGDVEHRDKLLSREERAANRSMMVCVSRAKSPKIVLDL
ncbi:MAG TPA: PDR/VanB family oxidoreductase [Ramlibacter sp.]|uniref:PDR/VanB family oxidoreductase n=1 Tax=Ramlibacter sp. TaxID=1917967 RepID=UPI002CDD6B19|nr:PDR/VanB family oxidoreductase [Ramlibacter sp.]HVZ45944.1 PDR/VanB family oxidoreductase [Ramlibacter sp.]